MTWTRITDSETAATLFPAWFGSRMVGTRGTFGLLLSTGDLMRITSITAVHQSPDGIVLLDVLLDHAGIPEGVDLAWRPKHYLGTPVPGATLATVMLGQVVVAVEFTAAEIAEPPADAAAITDIGAEPPEELAGQGSAPDAVAQALRG